MTTSPNLTSDCPSDFACGPLGDFLLHSGREQDDVNDPLGLIPVDNRHRSGTTSVTPLAPNVGCGWRQAEICNTYDT